MSSLEKVRYITKNYRALQGLRQVPIGVFLLTVAMSNSEAWPWYTMWKPVSKLLVLALLFGAYWLIGLYYKRNFGQVQSALDSERDTVKGIFFVLAIVVAFVIDLGLEPPVSVFGLTVAIWILSGSWEAGGLGVHYAFAARLLVGASLMPLTGVLNAERFSRLDYLYLWE